MSLDYPDVLDSLPLSALKENLWDNWCRFYTDQITLLSPSQQCQTLKRTLSTDHKQENQPRGSNFLDPSILIAERMDILLILHQFSKATTRMNGYCIYWIKESLTTLVRLYETEYSNTTKHIPMTLFLPIKHLLP